MSTIAFFVLAWAWMAMVSPRKANSSVVNDVSVRQWPAWAVYSLIALFVLIAMSGLGLVVLNVVRILG